MYIALVIFVFKIYASDEESIGSPGKVRNLHVARHKSVCTLYLTTRLQSSTHFVISGALRIPASISSVQVWQNLVDVAARQKTDAAAAVEPPSDYFLADNYNNSYLTMLSESGLIFGVINIVGNFGTVFVDQVSILDLIAVLA